MILVNSEATDLIKINRPGYNISYSYYWRDLYSDLDSAGILKLKFFCPQMSPHQIIFEI